MTNPSLLAVMISGLMGGVTTGLNSTLSNYFYIYLWGMTNAQISAITFAAGLGSVVAVGLASAVSRRFGKKRSMITLFYLSVFIGAVPLSLKLLGLAPPNGSLATTALLTADLFLAVTLGIMGLVIISSMIADVVEDAAVKTGKRSEGLLFAANGLLPKLTAGAGAFLGSLLIALVGLSGKLGAGVASPPGGHAASGDGLSAVLPGPLHRLADRHQLLPHRRSRASAERGRPAGQWRPLTSDWCVLHFQSELHLLGDDHGRRHAGRR